MEGGEGMVAVVRGLRDAGLAVTLLDGSREYTLMPNAVLNTPCSPNKQGFTHRSSKQQSTQHDAITTEVCKDYTLRNTGAQVTDGRYASVYKTTHCHMKPSSPPLELTEFPPQRALLSPGHGNFEVGGAGSGETYIPMKANGKFRGGMSWLDRGAVCSPRASHESDSFANSLRKYPCVSPDRSAEIVERLINYSQSRASKTYNMKNQTSPQRFPDPNSSNINLRGSRASTARSPQRWEPEPSDPRDSPTRDRARKPDGDVPEVRKTVYCKNYDVKCLKDIPKRFKDNNRVISTYPYGQPVCPPIKESYDHLAPSCRRFTDQYSNNSVNMEIQAAVKMVSKEVATVPRPAPARRNVAVPLSRTPSNADISEGDNTKSTQKYFTSKRKSVETVSLTDLSNSDNDFDVRKNRRSKSQEDIKVADEHFRRKVLAVFDNVKCNDSTMERIKDECFKRFLNKDRRAPALYNRCLYNVCPQYYNLNYNVENGRSRNLSSYDNKTHDFRAEMTAFNINEDIDYAVKDWVDGLPISFKDMSMNKIDILNNMAFKLKQLIMHRFRKEIVNLKTEILDFIVDIPIDTNRENRAKCLNKLADALVERIKNAFLFEPNVNRNVSVGTSAGYKIRNNSEIINRDILKDFIKYTLWEYFKRIDKLVSDNMIQDIENELTDIITNSLATGNQRDAKHQMKYILTELGKLKDDQASDIINILLDTFKKKTINSSYSQIFTVLQSTSQGINDTSDFSIGGITQGDLNANLDFYMNQLCLQIDDWLNNLNISQVQDAGFRQVVVHDLAGDIIDRHKYLELNPNSRGSDQEELEQLKYQIFKWINKLVGENNIETIQHAEELMDRIRTVPTPMLIIPNNDVSRNSIREQENTFPSPQNQNSSSSKYSSAQLSDVPRGRPKVGRSISSSGEFFFRPDMFQESVGSMNQNKIVTSPGALSSQILTSTPGATSQTVRPNLDESLAETKRGGYTNSPLSIKPSVKQQMSFESQRIGTRSVINPEGQRLSTPLHSSPQVNPNIQNTRMSCPGAISSGPMRTSDIGPVCNPIGIDGSIADTRNIVIPDNSLSGPKGIITSPTKQYSGNINQQSIDQNASLVSPKNVNQIADISYQPRISLNNSLDPQSMPCCPGKDPSSPTSHPSIKQLNDEFDEYLKQWLQQIPIKVSKPEEEAVAKKARLGLYNGIWKAITKLQFEPAIFNNRFYYQDVLDDEIEELLNILPKTAELESKKHALKIKLIEKTCDTNEQIISIAVNATYKQQLIEILNKSLHAMDKTDENVVKLYEEMQRINLVNYYILYIRYKDKDKVRGNVYRNKLLKKVGECIGKMKKSHNKELKDIDPDLYITEVVSALNKVPVPNENTIREEADEILLGIEIEQWFLDLPIVESLEWKVQMQRNSLRDTLTKKIYDIEKERNLSDCVASKELRHHITKFLEKIPLAEGTDTNFVTEELVNRLKNRPRDRVRKKTVAFQEPQDYQEFRNNMECCSTFRGPEGRIQNLNSISQRSVGFQEPQDYEEFSRNMPGCSSYTRQPGIYTPNIVPSFQPTEEQWLSLEETNSMRNCQKQIPVKTQVPQSTPFSISQLPDTNNFSPNNEVSLTPVPQYFPNVSQTCCGQQTLAGSSGVGYSKASTLPCGKTIPEHNTTFYKSTDHQGIQGIVENRSMHQSQDVHPSGSDGRPAGYSTPQQIYKQFPPERPKKSSGQVPRLVDDARRRLEMEDTESEGERDKYIECRCGERSRRCRRRRPILVTCGDYEKCPQFIPCPCAYFL